MNEKQQILQIIQNNTKKIISKVKKAGLWDWVLSQLPVKYKDISNETEILYLVLNEEASPICTGGNKCYFWNMQQGFSIRCNRSNVNCICKKQYLKSDQWLDINLKAKQKREFTLKKHYGVSNPSQSKEIQERKIQTNIEKFCCAWGVQSNIIKEKISKTSYDKYGVANVLQRPELRKKLTEYRTKNLDQLLEKTQKTNLVKYGFVCSLNNPEIQQKSINTNLQKYNVSWVTQSLEMKKKSKETCLRKYGVSNPMQSADILKNISDNEKKISGRTWNSQRHFTTETYNLLINPELLQNEINLYGVPFLAKQLNIAHKTLYNAVDKYNLLLSENNSYEAEIANWLDINHILYIRNDRTQLKPKELDFYLPDQNIAIEFQGTYWHMDPQIFEATAYNFSTHKTAEQHWINDKNKINLCFNKGIELIIIWENEWNSNKNYIKSQILKTIDEAKELI